MFYFLTYPALFTFFRFAARLLGRVQSSGEGNVPQTGAFIYCPNHLSDADPPTLFVTMPRRAWYVAKAELFEIKSLGWFFRRFHAIPIKRDSADRGALRKAEAVLRSGSPLVIFPEGRCAEDGHLQRIQPGAAMLALRTGVPIVPVGLKNTNQMLPYRDVVPRFSKDPVTVAFGPPIFLNDYAHLRHSEAIQAITAKIGEELAILTGQ